MSKINRIEIIPINIPLTEPFVISRGTKTHAENTVIIIYDEDGNFGTGECCPFRSIHGETQAGTIAVAKYLAPQFIGMEATAIHDMVDLMDRLITGNASVKCAFDMAFYDLAAKVSNLPLYAYLNGSRDKLIHTDMTVSLLEKEKMVEKALKYQGEGFPVLKIKLGTCPSSKDIDRIVSIRKVIGDDIPIRIDANQGWNYYEANSALQELNGLGIEHCEEPLPAWNRLDQIKLNQSSPIPIMADESVFNHHDAYQIIASNAASMINIKLGKSGGICNAMKIASVAEAAGVYCQVGCFSESRVGISALTHFALVWKNIIHYDLDAPLMLSEDPVVGGISYHSNGRVEVTDDLGHGASFDEVFLNRFEKISID